MPRRLPVIQSSAAEDEAAASRPRWHWVLIGAGLTVTLWAPLVALSLPLVRLTAPSPLAALPPLVAFAAAAFGGGALVGRFGGRAGPTEAAAGAALAALVAAFLAFASPSGISGAVGLGAAVGLGLVGAVFGRLGGAFGFRKRPC